MLNFLAHAQGLRQRQRMGKARLVGLGRDDPDVVGHASRDSLQDREPFGMDAVVVGQKDAHERASPFG